MKKNKKVVIICAIIVIIIVISLIFALVYKSKTGKLPFEKQTEENQIIKMVENDKMKVTLGEVATTDDYMIIEYDVEIKDEDLKLEGGTLDDISFAIDREIKIDGKQIADSAEQGQFAYQSADNTVKVYDLVNTKNIKMSDTYKLEVIVYDIYGDSSAADATTEEIDPSEDENTDPSDEPDYNDEEEYVDEATTDDGYEEVTVDSDEYYQAIENIDEDNLDVLDEPSQDDEEWNIEETTEEGASSDTEKIGTIRVELNKTETNKNASEIKKNEKDTQDNVTISVNTIIKTNTAKFITVETEITGITKDKLESEDLTSTENLQIALLDKDGNVLNTNKIEKSTLYGDDGNELDALDDDTTLENGKVQITTQFALMGDDKDKSDLKAQAYFVKATDDISNKTWYAIEDQQCTAENAEGGEIAVTKIETTSDEITFYFTKKGFIDELNSLILIRNKGKESYITPDTIENIRNNEYKATFLIENYEQTQEEIEETEEYTILTNAEDSEFALLENNDVQIIGGINV